MANTTQNDLYIAAELPKRPYTDQSALTVGHVPVATGTGLEVEARLLTSDDLSDEVVTGASIDGNGLITFTKNGINPPDTVQVSVDKMDVEHLISNSLVLESNKRYVIPLSIIGAATISVTLPPEPAANDRIIISDAFGKAGQLTSLTINGSGTNPNNQIYGAGNPGSSAVTSYTDNTKVPFQEMEFHFIAGTGWSVSHKYSDSWHPTTGNSAFKLFNTTSTGGVSFDISDINLADFKTIKMPNRNIDLDGIGAIPAHASGVSYSIGQVVYYNSQELRCRTAHTSSDGIPDYTKFSPVSGTLIMGGGLGTVTPPINPEILAVEIYTSNVFTLNNTDITTYPVKIISSANNIEVFGYPTALAPAAGGPSQNPKLGYAESVVITNGNKWIITSNEAPDNTFRIKDNVVPTKKIAFEASGITSGNTRTITMPDANVALGQMMNTITVDTMFSTYTVPAQESGVDPAQRYHYICYESFVLDATAMQGVVWATNPTGYTVYMNLTGSAVTYQNDTGTAITQVVLNAGDSVYLTKDGLGIITARRYNSSSSGTFRIYDSTTPSKRMAWDVSGIASSTTRTVTMPNVNVNLGDLPNIANFNSNITSNNGTILSRNSSSSTANGVVLLSGDSLSASFNYSTPGAVVARTGKGASSWLRPAVCETLLTDYALSLTSNALTIAGVTGTANQPYACSPTGSTFWTLGGGLDLVAVHTLTFIGSVSGGSGNVGIFSGQRRITVSRLTATNTYAIVNTQTIGADDAGAGISGITVTVTLVSDRLNIVISCTAASGTTLATSASLTTLTTSLG